MNVLYFAKDEKILSNISHLRLLNVSRARLKLLRRIERNQIELKSLSVYFQK